MSKSLFDEGEVVISSKDEALASAVLRLKRGAVRREQLKLQGTWEGMLGRRRSER